MDHMVMHGKFQDCRIEAVDCRAYAAVKIRHCKSFNEQQKLTCMESRNSEKILPARSKASHPIQYPAVESLG